MARKPKPEPRRALVPCLAKFRKELKHRMVDLDLDQKTLAEKVGVSGTAISYLLDGSQTRDVRLSTLMGIAKATGCVIAISHSDLSMDCRESA